MLAHLIYTSLIMKYSVYKEASMLGGVNTAVNRPKLHTPAGFRDQPVWNGPTKPPRAGKSLPFVTLADRSPAHKLRSKSFARVFLFLFKK